MKLKILKLKEGAFIPEYKTSGAAGMDLYSLTETILKPGDIKLIDTGIAMELPPGFEAQIRPRSGLSLKGISVTNSPGTIDSDYRGEVKIILSNYGLKEFKVNKGDRIAQIVFAQFAKADIEEVSSLQDSERGTGGFGSTGV